MIAGATLLFLFVPLTILFLGIWERSTDPTTILFDIIFAALAVLGFVLFILGTSLPKA